MHAKKLQTQRSVPRFRVKDRTIALLSLAIPFHIIDLSVNGLSFRYVGREKWFPEPLKLDIAYDGHRVKGIAVKAVADLQIAEGFVPMRRHAVEFVKLSPAQLAELTRFIELHTEAEL